MPVLPFEWTNGIVRGICARGSFVVDIKWKEGELSSVLIKSLKSGHCVIRTQKPISITGMNAKSLKSGNWYLTSFETSAGKSYQAVGRRRLEIDACFWHGSLLVFVVIQSKFAKFLINKIKNSHYEYKIN